MRLNLNCTAEYIGSFLSETESNELFEGLQKYEMLTKPFTLTLATGEVYKENYGKMMFIDEDLFRKNSLPNEIWGPNNIWSENMALLKHKIAHFTGHQFQTCVCIYYPNGEAGVDYHSDPVAFGDTSIVASVSLGEEREFHLREKESMKTTSLILEHGSLLVMGEHCQERYEHALPVNTKYSNARINLTFRKFGFE